MALELPANDERELLEWCAWNESDVDGRGGSASGGDRRGWSQRLSVRSSITGETMPMPLVAAFALNERRLPRSSDRLPSRAVMAGSE